MKEIGSEFWDVPVKDRQTQYFPGSVQWYLSGRDALRSVVPELTGCSSVAIPSWCCESMIRPFADAGFRICLYPVYWNKRLIQELDFNCDVLLVMDYFGYSSECPNLTGYNGVVIRDVTHSVFSSTYDDAEYYFGSLRKWVGVWTGGFAWTRSGKKIRFESAADTDTYIEYRKKAMEHKADYIHGRCAQKDYLKSFEAAEALLDAADKVSAAADRDIWLAEHLDIEFIKNRRRENAEILRTAFSDWLIFPEMRPDDSPMFVPALVPFGKRDLLRRYLTEHEIYCPVHWPKSSYHQSKEKADYIFQNELSLVCDQRYTENDMRRIIDTVQQFFREEN